MAGTIKGITLEIGGTTTKLTQALKAPQKECMTLQAKLKDVNKSLKLDPSNVDLLGQKQRLLTQTISSTEQELQLLKEAQKQYISSGKDIDGAEYIALEAKIKKTEQSLEALKKQQNNFSAEIQSFGIKVGELGTKTENLGKKFLPVTAGVTAVGTATTAAWSELDEAYDGIAAGTGATGEALQDLQENFNHVYGNFPAESAEVGTAIADINTRFGLSGKALEEASTQFLKYAQVNNTDVSGSIENVAKAMADAKIPTSELGTVLDKLTVASQASGLPVDQLSAALSKNGVSMRELGFSTDETIALLTTFEKQGVDTSVVLTGMKAAVKNCAAQGKDAKTEMASLFEAIQSGSATAADAQELFGSKAGAALYNYAREGKLNIQDMMDVIANSAGGLDQTFNDMLDPADKVQVALNNLKIVGADLGSQIQATLAPMIEKLAETCRKLTDWFTNLSPQAKDLIVEFGLIAAAIGPLLIAVGKMELGFSKMIAYFGNTATWGGKLISMFSGIGGGITLTLGPILAIVAAIAAVGAAFVSLWNSNSEFRDRMISIWESIVAKVGAFCDGIVQRINSLGFNFQSITEAIQAIWDGFCGLLAPVFEGVWQQVETVLSAALDIIMGLVDTFIALFQGDWDGFWAGIQTIWDACWSGIGNTIQNILDTILGIISTFLGWFGINWTPAFDEISQNWQTIWTAISDFASQILTGIQELAAAFVSLFQGDWDGFCSHLSSAWSTLWNGIQQFGSTVWNGIKGVFSNVWNGIKTVFDNVMQEIKSKCESVWNGIKGFLSGIWEGLKSTCSNVWTGIKNSIVNPINDALGSVKSIFNSIKNAISDRINGAKDAVSSAIGKIKNLFNFKISWPHIPLPHFSVSGSANPLDWLKGQIPRIGISWYAKAMDKGMILNSPTIFGMAQNGQLLGGGEAGAEAVIGVNSLQRLIENAVDRAAMRRLEQIKMETQNSSVSYKAEIDYDQMASALLSALSGVVIQNSVNVGLKPVLNEMIPLIDKGLEKRKNRR